MRTIIAGSRSITDMELLLKAIRSAQRAGLKITTILCGGANGVDALGKEYAAKNNIPIEYYPADWNRHGKSAGYIRNQEMVHKAEALIALWDNKSNGTKHTIDLAEKAELKVCLTIILPKKKASEKEVEKEVESQTPAHKRRKGKKHFAIENRLTEEGADRQRQKLEEDIERRMKWTDGYSRYETLKAAEQGLADIERKKKDAISWRNYLKDYEHRIKEDE